MPERKHPRLCRRAPDDNHENALPNQQNVVLLPQPYNHEDVVVSPTKQNAFPSPPSACQSILSVFVCSVSNCKAYRHNAIRLQPITGSCTPPLHSASYTHSNCVLTCTPQGPEPAPPPARARSLQRWGTQEWQGNAIWMSGRSPTAQHRPAPPARGSLTRHAHNHAVVDAQHKALHARGGVGRAAC